MKIIDASSNTINEVKCIAASGINVIFRYYASEVNWKVITEEEAQAISGAGMQVGVVFEDGVSLNSFTEQNGYDNAIRAYHYATNAIKQPLNSAIYFAVDLNVTDEQIQNNIIPYFAGIQNAFKTLSGGGTSYKVGAYGCGAAVNAVFDQKLCDFRWLSCSSSYNGTQEAIDNGNYEMLQHFNASAEVCSIGVDNDTVRDGVTDVGAFKL